MRRFLWQLIIPLVTVLVIGTVVFVYGIWAGRDLYILAACISDGGTILILLYNVLWIVLMDSKKRWPNLGAFDRFARLITFGR